MRIRVLLHWLCLFLAPPALAATAEDLARWIVDIDHYEAQLHRKHINLYHQSSHEAFSEELEALKTRLPALDEYQIRVELMRITRLIGDGHTQFAFWASEHHYFPFSFVFIEDDFRVTRTRPAYAHLLGQKLAAVDGTAAHKLRELLSPVVQGVENEHSLSVRLAEQAPVAEILHGLGVTADLEHARFVFADDEGKKSAVRVTAAPMDQHFGAMTRRIPAPKTPFEKRIVAVSDDLWYSADPIRRVGYLNFSGYAPFESMVRFASDMRSHLEKNEFRYLIIDLRHNAGGDFFLGLALASELVLVDNLDWGAGVYALIGPKTFSAGMSNAAQFRQILNARLIGEPTGADPVGYQDMDRFTLPNSGLTITYSKRMYRFRDTPSEGLQPHTHVETTWAHHQSGYDAPLEWILGDIASNGFPRSTEQ